MCQIGTWRRMRYSVRGNEVRSENAAKPACSAGAWLLNWITQLDSRDTALDLGCGKLRYTVPLAIALRSVTAVDSSAQLDRTQKLFGIQTSIREYAAEYLPNVRVCALEETDWRREQFGVVLCSNVLSAIPSRSIRNQVVRTAYQRLANGGVFLLTTQYKNSHFAAWGSNPRASRYCDGFLVKTTHGVSFYALLDSTALVTLCRSSGLTIIEAGHAKEIAYVIATRGNRKIIQCARATCRS